MAYFSKAFIKILRNMNVHHEKIVEYSGVSKCGLWAIYYQGSKLEKSNLLHSVNIENENV